MPSKSNNCWVTAGIVIFEIVALAAALVAICSTFWLDPVRTAKGPVLPGVDHAGLWRVCYDHVPVGPGFAAATSTPATVQLLSSTILAEPNATATNGGGVPVATDAPTASVAAAPPRRAGAVDEEKDRLTNVSKIVLDVREDITSNFPFSKRSAMGCADNVRAFYSNIWGTDFDDQLQAVRVLTLAFAFLGAVKLLALIFSSLCCLGCAGGGSDVGYDDNRVNRDGRVAIGWISTLQVLAGWAGWLVYLWILLDIRANEAAHEAAELAGTRIDTAAAGRVESYWGSSFWLFLASTLVTTIGSLFGCC